MSKKLFKDEKPVVGRIFSEDEAEPGFRDALHVPCILVSAAVPLQAGERVFFVDPQTVHPAGFVRANPRGRCCDCYAENKELVGISKHSGKVCEYCFDTDSCTRFINDNAPQALIDPFIERAVEPGEYVFAFPLPGLVSTPRHTFELTGVPQSGKLRIVTEDDEDWLNDSCRGCY